MQLTLPTLSQGDVLFWLTVVGIVGGGLIRLRKKTKPVWEDIKFMLQDWRGVSDRPGVPGRPGVMERIDSIEHIAKEARYHSMPNGGNSAYDQLTRKLDENRADVGQVQSDVSALVNTLAEHSSQLNAFGERMDASENDREGIHREISVFKFGGTERQTS